MCHLTEKREEGLHCGLYWLLLLLPSYWKKEHSECSVTGLKCMTIPRPESAAYFANIQCTGLNQEMMTLPLVSASWFLWALISSLVEVQHMVVYCFGEIQVNERGLPRYKCETDSWGFYVYIDIYIYVCVCTIQTVWSYSLILASTLSTVVTVVTVVFDCLLENYMLICLRKRSVSKIWLLLCLIKKRCSF